MFDIKAELALLVEQTVGRDENSLQSDELGVHSQMNWESGGRTFSRRHVRSMMDTLGGRNTEGHVRELPIQLWDDFAHNLGSTSGCRDDVLGSTTATMPQFPRGVIHSLLGSCDGMDCGYESFHNATVVMDDLDHGG
ncbi:hypothetical protein U0070_015536 [Myodes glareolus]|uniref:Uncharacterized protein n=1 Tax=Myodes glareolus TaxID=447135 RepID=A0AAW0IGC7_MYOGA